MADNLSLTATVREGVGKGAEREIDFASSGDFIPTPTRIGKSVYFFILLISSATTCLTGTLDPVTPATDT